MRPMPALPLLLLALTALLLGACSTLTPSSLASKTLADVPRVHNSAGLPCGTQREIAGQNTYLDVATGAAKDGTAYKAPCDMGKKAPATS